MSEELPRYTKNNPYCIEIITADRNYVFACSSYQDVRLWYERLSTVSKSITHNRVMEDELKTIRNVERQIAVQDSSVVKNIVESIKNPQVLLVHM